MLDSIGESFSDDSVKDGSATLHLRHLPLYGEKSEGVAVSREGEDPNIKR